MKRKIQSKYISKSNSEYRLYYPNKKRKIDLSFDLEENVEEIVVENVELDCVVCLDAKKDVAVVPCGHVCFCTICSKLNFHSCPLCNVKIHSMLKIYL